jgi:hypothetical protein
VPVMYCLYRLKEDADKNDWDAFVRDEDIPLTLALPSVISYRVHRIGKCMEGSTDYDYIEMLEFSDQEALARDMAGDRWEEGMRAMYQNGLADEVCFLVNDVTG